MTEREIRLRRTQGSGPPSDLAFGEAAFSEEDESLYVGRFDKEEPPVMFRSDFSALEAAIAALLSQPVTHGFNYDQQEEPVAAAGETWRERSAGGLIVAEWEWSGSVWLSLQTLSRPFTALASGQTFTGVAAVAELLDPTRAYLYLGFRGTAWANAPTNGSNYWLLRVQANRRNPSSDSVTDGNAYETLASSTPFTVNVEGQSVVNLQASEVFQYSSGFIGFRLWSQTVGAPGSLRLVLSILYRRIRA